MRPKPPRTRVDDHARAQWAEAESLRLSPEYAVDGQRVSEFLGAPEQLPKEMMDVHGAEIWRFPTTLKRDGYNLELYEAIGKGAQGAVLRAQRTVDPSAPEEIRAALPPTEDIVVKRWILERTSPMYAQRYEAMQREIAALSQNKMLYDAYLLQTQGVEDTVVVMIEMKKMKGPDAYEYIESLKEHPELRTPEELLKIMKMFRSCLVQLRVLAKRGWQHRDIKPANVMVNDGNARLTDFGIARRLEDTTGEHSTSGTPVYMTPHTVTGTRDVFADLYALGLIAAEEAGYVERAKTSNDVQVMMLIIQGKLWEATSALSEGEQDAFRSLIEKVVQLGKGHDKYRNPFGDQEFSQQNLVDTITAVLRPAHEAVKQQERVVEEQQRQSPRIAA